MNEGPEWTVGEFGECVRHFSRNGEAITEYDYSGCIRLSPEEQREVERRMVEAQTRGDLAEVERGRRELRARGSASWEGRPSLATGGEVSN